MEKDRKWDGDVSDCEIEIWEQMKTNPKISRIVETVWNFSSFMCQFWGRLWHFYAPLGMDLYIQDFYW